MAIGQDARTYLLSKSAVTTVVGTRVFPNFIPEKNTSYPVIVYAVVSQVPAHNLAGGAGYAETRIQLDVYCKTAVERDSLTEILRNELQGFAGTMGSSTVSSVVYRNAIDLYEPPIDSSDVGLFRNSTDYWIRHSQSVPSLA